jgi:hypothetical protein
MIDDLLENEELEEEENIEDNDLFLHNLNSTLYVKKDFDMKEFDYEWLDKIEDCLPYIDNILRNPKRFIINEEEVVKVELARRVTVESIIHLTQHTSLIQKIEDDGDVKPSKILNINKEESMDTYENRFIYTLLDNLRLFFQMRVEATAGQSYCLDKNTLQYAANTKVFGENLKINIDVSDVTKNIKEHSGDKGNMTLDDRLRRAKMQIDGFFGTELMQILGKLHFEPVRSPIKKTNVILKNTNFQYAMKLWDYLQNHVADDTKIFKSNKKYEDNGILKEYMNNTFLFDYLAMNTISAIDSNDRKKEVIDEITDNLIQRIVELNVDLPLTELKEKIGDKIAVIKYRNEASLSEIQNAFSNRIKSYLEKVENIKLE